MGGGVITRRPEQMRTRESQKRMRSSFVKIRLHVLSEACDDAERLVRGLRGIGSVDVESLAGPWAKVTLKKEEKQYITFCIFTPLTPFESLDQLLVSL